MPTFQYNNPKRATTPIHDYLGLPTVKEIRTSKYSIEEIYTPFPSLTLIL